MLNTVPHVIDLMSFTEFAVFSGITTDNLEIISHAPQFPLIWHDGKYLIPVDEACDWLISQKSC